MARIALEQHRLGFAYLAGRNRPTSAKVASAQVCVMSKFRRAEIDRASSGSILG